MKSLVLLLMFATLATGCSSSSLSESDAYRRMRMKEISSMLEVKALTPFVRQVAATNPSVAGISVSSARIESGWRWDEFWAVFTLSNGDWSFHLDYGDQGGFWLFFRYSEEAVISFHCVAESRTDFRVVSVAREDLIILDPVISPKKVETERADPVAPDNSGQRSALTSVSDLKRSAEEMTPSKYSSLVRMLEAFVQEEEGSSGTHFVARIEGEFARAGLDDVEEFSDLQHALAMYCGVQADVDSLKIEAKFAIRRLSSDAKSADPATRANAAQRPS